MVLEFWFCGKIKKRIADEIFVHVSYINLAKWTRSLYFSEQTLYLFIFLFWSMGIFYNVKVQ